MTRNTHFVLLITVACLAIGAVNTAAAQPVLRDQRTVRGDFVLIGNTLGHDCGAGVPAPVVGTVGACGTNTADTSPDVFWESNAPTATTARANNTITVANARSTAMLALPSGANVQYARLYWSARLPGGVADTTATIARPGVFTSDLTASASVVRGAYYQSSAEVTTIVQTHGVGAFRVSGVNANNFVNLNEQVTWAAWWLVVFYEDVTQPTRNLALFDGLDLVSGLTNPATSVATVLDGFLVPNSGFDAKLGVIAYEGDGQWTGDSFRFRGFSTVMPPALGNADRLNNGIGAVDNFFSSSRTRLGSAVSVTGDLPQTTGAARSMSSFDMHVVDVTSRVSAGQTRAAISATSSLEEYFLGGFVTSISTLQPDFTSSEKTVVDVNGGSLLAGDELEYTINVVNQGTDAAIGVVLEDVLSAGVTFVPGTLQVLTGANSGTKTDGAGDDQAEYDAVNHRILFRLGTSANASVGGTIPINGSSSVRFRVRIVPRYSGLLENQGTVTAAGQQGADTDSWGTDGNGDGDGAPPTSVLVHECDSDIHCSGATPLCDSAGTPRTCVECLSVSDCNDSNECTSDSCNTGACSNPALPVGAPCTLGVCNSSVVCASLSVSITSPADGAATTDTTPTLIGTATAGLTVSIAVDGNPVGTTTANGGGSWSFTIATSLTDGTYTLEATVTASDNSATASDAIDLTIDTVTTVAITSPGDGDVIADNSPTIAGIGEVGATVSVTIDANPIGTVQVANNGTWFIAVPSSLGVGTYTVAASILDAAGNTANDSISFEVVQCLGTIDCTGALVCNTGTNTCVQCLTAANCNDSNDCTTDACNSGTCSNAAVASNTACSAGVCNGTGSCVECLSTGNCSGGLLCNTGSNTCVQCLTAANCDDSNDCTTNACSSGTCTFPAATTGSTCSGGVCNGASSCVDCVTNSDCSGGLLCNTGSDTCVQCLTEANCDDNNDCTADTCNSSSCGHAPVSSGAACSGGVCNGASSCVDCLSNSDCTGGLLCNTGSNTCVQCLTATDCNDSNECTTDACNSGTCSNAPVTTGDECTGGVCNPGGNCVDCVTTLDCTGALVCNTGTNTCVQCVSASDCNDGNECTVDACSSATCTNTAATVGDACSVGVCDTTQTCSAVSVSITEPADGSATGNPTPVVRGRGTAGLTVTITLDGNDIGSVTIDSNGDWQIAVGTLGDGPHTVVASVTTGNGSDDDEVTFRVDTTTFVAITSPADGATVLDRTPNIIGTGEPGATVVVSIDGTEVGTVTVDSNGEWLVIITDDLANDTYAIDVELTDLVGNTATAAATFTVDVSSEVSITEPVNGSVINNVTPTVIGTALPGATVVITIDDGNTVTTLGTVTADGTGIWSLEVQDTLLDATYTVVATATDTLGGMAQDSVTFRVDTVTTVTIDAVDVATGDITGSGEAGATIVVTINGTDVGATTVDSGGVWTFNVGTGFAPGTYNIIVVATDEAGNSATDSLILEVEEPVDPDTDAGIITVDAGTDAAVLTDASMVFVDAGLDLDAGATDSGVVADSGTDASFMNDGAVEPPPTVRGRYAGGGLCSASNGTTGSPLALGLFLCVGAGLTLRRRSRRS